MKKIAKIVEEIIARSPILAEALQEDITNASKVARKIKGEVEAEKMEKISEAAILAAVLRRRVKPVARSGMALAKKVGDITVRSDLVEYIFYNPPDLLRVHQEILRRVEKSPEDIFLNIARGTHESLVIVSKKFAPMIETLLEKKKVIRKVSNLASVTLRLPDASMFASGVYYPFVKVLAWRGISFVEIISIANELSFIVEQKDIEAAFTAIKSVASSP